MKTTLKILIGFSLLAALAMCFTSCTQESRIHRLQAKADQYYENGNFDAAEVEYLNILKMIPRDSHAVAQLGRIFHLQGRYLRSLAYLKHALGDQPEELDLKLLYAKTCQYLGDRSSTLSIAGEILSLHPSNQAAILLLADSAVEPDEIQQAKDCLSALSETEALLELSRVASGIIHMRQEDIEKAKEVFESTLQTYPESSASHLGMGTSLLLQEDNEQAETHFKLAAHYAEKRTPIKLIYSKLLFNKGEIQKAKKELEAIVNDTPDYVPAWTSLARISFSEGDYEECERQLKHTLGRDSAELDSLLIEGALKVVRGEIDEAIAHYEQMAFTAFGKVPQVHYSLALAHIHDQDKEKAMLHLNRAIRLNEQHTQASLLLSELNLHAGNPTSAILMLKGLTDRLPQLRKGYELLAEAYLAQENPVAALHVYDQMVALFPDDPNTKFIRGNLLLNQQRYDEARSEYLKVLEHSPDYIPAIERLVDLDIIKKDYAQALKRSTNAADQLPDKAEPWLLMAKVHLAESSLQLAETTLKKAREKNPELQMPYLLLAGLYTHQKQFSEAIDTLDQLIQHHPDNGSAWLQKGMIQEKQGLLEEASTAYHQVLELTPNSLVALNNLAYLYAEHLNDPVQAYQMAKKARQLAPLDPSIADTLGWVLFKMNEYPHALSLLESAIKQSPEIGEIQYHIGMTHYMLGNRDLARQHLEKAIQCKEAAIDREQVENRLAILSIDPSHATPQQVALMQKAVEKNDADPVLSNMLAEYYTSQENYNEATDLYETLIAQGVASPKIKQQLAKTYEIQGNITSATRLAKEAYDQSPKDGDLIHLLGRLLLSGSDLKWANSLLMEAKRLMPDSALVTFDLARSHYSLGNIQQSNLLIEEALKKGLPPSHVIHSLHFLSMVGDDPIHEKLPWAMEWLNKNPDDVPSLMIVAESQEANANYEAARDTYKECLSIYPTFYPAAKHLAQLSLDVFKNPLNAYDWAQQGIDANPDDIDLMRILGLSAFHKGDYVQSLDLLKRSSLIVSNQPDIHFYIAKNHFHLGQLSEGRRAIEHALALGLTGKLGEEAKLLLNEHR